MKQILALLLRHVWIEPAPRRSAGAPVIFSDPSKLNARQRRGAERRHFHEVRTLNWAIADVCNELHQPVIRGHAAIDSQALNIGAIGRKGGEQIISLLGRGL